MANNQFRVNPPLKNIVDSCLSTTFLRLHQDFCGINILGSKKLKPTDKLVLGLILSFQSQGRPFKMGTRRMADKLGLSRATTSRSVEKLLGRNSPTDTKFITSRPIYWQTDNNNEKVKHIKGRELTVNLTLCQKYLDNKRKNNTKPKPKSKAFQGGTHTKSHNKTGVLQNEAPHKFPTDKGLHASSKNKKYTPLQNEAGSLQNEAGVLQNETPPSQNEAGSLQNEANNITYKNKDKNINKNNSSSSSSSGSSSSDLEDDDDDDFSNSNSISNSEMVNSGNLHANGSLHIADNNSHSSLNKATRASVSESNTENEVATSDKGNKDIGKELSPKNEFNRIAVGKLVKAFPKLRQNDNVSDTVRMLIRKYGDEALQKGIEATVVRCSNVRTPIPYLIKLVSNLSKQVAKQNKGKDPNIPCGLTQNQWNMLTWHQKRTDIAQMMIKCHKQGGRAYIESFIKRYNLHETDTKEDKNLPYTNIEEQYMGLINAYEIQRDSLRGGFERKLSAGDENAYKKQYYTFTLARLIEWTAKDYHLDVGNLVITTTISIDFKKEEAKIEQYDSGDISQLSIDEYVYRHYMKHLKLAKLKAKKRDIMDKRQKENLAFYHKKFGNRPFNHNKHDIMKRWASKLPNKVMISIYKQQFNNKSVHQCTTDEIFRLIKNGINDYRSNEKPKVKSN